MALICIAGVDRSGKTTVAKMYEAQGYKYVHMSAPDKKYKEYGYVGPSYLDDYIEMLNSWVNENVVCDRFWDGELIWPKIFGREPLLDDDDIDVIREVEATIGAEYILMEDPDVEAHWKRCVANKEPLNKQQFLAARAMYGTLAKKYGFVKKQLSDFTKAVMVDEPVISPVEVPPKSVSILVDGLSYEMPRPVLTPEQIKLAKANAINSILSKNILKNKGPEYEDLEKDIRGFLNTKLGLLLGSSTEEKSFNKDEVEVLKIFCQQWKQKEQLKNGRK